MITRISKYVKKTTPFFLRPINLQKAENIKRNGKKQIQRAASELT